jgi:hypothetical protein
MNIPVEQGLKASDSKVRSSRSYTSEIFEKKYDMSKIVVGIYNVKFINYNKHDGKKLVTSHPKGQ